MFGATVARAQTRSIDYQAYFPEEIIGLNPVEQPREPCNPPDPELDLSYDPDYGLHNLRAASSATAANIYGFSPDLFLDLDFERVYYADPISKARRNCSQVMKICICVAGLGPEPIQLCKPSGGRYDSTCHYTIGGLPPSVSDVPQIEIFTRGSGWIGQDDGLYHRHPYDLWYNYLCDDPLITYDSVDRDWCFS